jgi:hypothetical protein
MIIDSYHNKYKLKFDLRWRKRITETKTRTNLKRRTTETEN